MIEILALGLVGGFSIYWLILIWWFWTEVEK